MTEPYESDHRWVVLTDEQRARVLRLVEATRSACGECSVYDVLRLMEHREPTPNMEAAREVLKATVDCATWSVPAPCRNRHERRRAAAMRRRERTMR